METDVIEQDAHADHDRVVTARLRARLRAAQRKVAAIDDALRERAELIQAASAQGWSDQRICDVLSEVSPISIYQVKRLRKGQSSGRAYEGIGRQGAR